MMLSYIGYQPDLFKEGITSAATTLTLETDIARSNFDCGTEYEFHCNPAENDLGVLSPRRNSLQKVKVRIRRESSRKNWRDASRDRVELKKTANAYSS